MSETAVHPLTERILSGQAPEALCKAAARGAVPVPPAELLRLRVHLAGSGSEEVAGLARESLAEQAAEDLVPAVSDEGCPPDVLDYVARHRPRDAKLIAAVLQNPATPDEALVDAAGQAGEEVVERILDNQVRLLRCPQLVDALDANPAVTGTHRTRLHDLQEELARRARREELRKAAPEPVAEEPAAETPAPVEETPAPAQEPLPAPDVAEAAPEIEEDRARDYVPDEGDVLNRIMSMSVPEKVELALKGNREERAILIRDPIKVVSLAVIKSPKITEREVESFAGMRNIVEDVIQRIAENREWSKNYTVVLALCKNPKAPVRKVMTMMTRLNNRDLKLLGMDRGIAEAVRIAARRFYLARTQPQTGLPGRKH
jgi:hypothetical protein